MTEPIKPGDLVIVLRNHCTDLFVGHIFTAGATMPSQDRWCGSCKKAYGPGPIVRIWDNNTGLPVEYLKRIPPLSELEGEKRDEEITA